MTDMHTLVRENKTKKDDRTSLQRLKSSFIAKEIAASF